MKNNLNKDILDPNCSDRHDMFIADYAQCLKIPQYHSDQPGETYFISPMSINLFGIYNCDTDKMNAFIYPAYESGKGGDDVCSLLWINLKNNVLIIVLKLVGENSLLYLIIVQDRIRTGWF